MRRLESPAFQDSPHLRRNDWPDGACNECGEKRQISGATVGGFIPFEACDKRIIPLAKAPSVTVQEDGMISLNRTAHHLVDNAGTVELHYDRDRQVMALIDTGDSCPHASAVRNGSKRGPGQAIVSATAYTAHYGIDTTATRRWKLFIEDGMLCMDLTQEGTFITGNSTRSIASPDPVVDSRAQDHATPA